MKITIAQLNYKIGDFEWNYNKIKIAIEKAQSDKSDLVVFSELAISAYSPFDMLKKEKFIENCQKYLEKIAVLTNNIAIIIGLPSYCDSENKEKLFNSIAFIENGKIKKYISKTLLSNEIFNENNYFEANNKFEIINYKDKKIAVTISNDIFNEKNKENSPIEKLSKLNPDFFINVSAIPYSHNSDEKKKNILKEISLKYSFPIVYVNQVGGNTGLIYDGGSLVVANSEILYKSKKFTEEIQTVDTNIFQEKPKDEKYEDNKIENIYNALILGIRDYFEKNSFKKAVIGLSGGIDSALTLAIAVEALGKDNVMSILMPSKYSSDHSINDSLEMLKRTMSPYKIISIEEIRLSFLNTLSEVFSGTQENVSEENIQARIRGSILMAYSNKFGNILLNTSNKSEFAVGYSTLYGDMNGALSVLGDIYKSEVYELSNYINKTKGNIIPENIITKAPSAELRPNQKDQDSLPPYDILDSILFSYIEENKSKEEINFDKALVEKVVSMVNNNEFKRYQAAPILRVSSKAFGSERCFPIVAKY